MYSKTYNPKRYEEISELLEAVSTLEEGGRLTLSPSPKEDRGRVRYLIYDWLYHMSMKKSFRLQEEEGCLIIRRRPSLTNITFQVEQPPLPSHLDSLFKELLIIDSLEEVKKSLEGQQLGEGEAALLQRHWKRVMN